MNDCCCHCGSRHPSRQAICTGHDDEQVKVTHVPPLTISMCGPCALEFIRAREDEDAAKPFRQAIDCAMAPDGRMSCLHVLLKGGEVAATSPTSIDGSSTLVPSALCAACVIEAGPAPAGRKSCAGDRAGPSGLPDFDLMSGDETRDGVSLTNLDQPLFEKAEATKRDLVNYLDAVADQIIPELRDRPLSVIRVLRGQEPFMQKNLPKYTPPWVRTVRLWAESSRREVSYALCNDRRTLLWFANQRAVEYHPGLIPIDAEGHPTHLVLDLDPPSSDGFGLAVRAAHLIRQALAGANLVGAVKTSGAKGLHVFVPLAQATVEDVAAAARAIAARAERLDPALATTAFIREDRGGKVFLDSTRVGGATVVAAYSPRIRPGVPVSFPVPWDELDRVAPGDFTVHTAARLIAEGASWAGLLPEPQTLSPELIEEGRAIPVARVQAMHEGKRRARDRRS